MNPNSSVAIKGAPRTMNHKQRASKDLCNGSTGIGCMLLALAMTLSGLCCGTLSAAAGEKISVFESQDGSNVSSEESASVTPDYDSYLQTGLSQNKPQESVRIEAVAPSGTSGDGVNAQSQVQGKAALSFTQDDSWAEWEITVPVAGYYHLSVDYCPLQGKQTDVQIGIDINGKIPFTDAGVMLLTRRYREASAIQKDTRGNSIRPAKEEVFEWCTSALQDKSGVYEEPYFFYFSAGVSRIRLTAHVANVAVNALTLYNELPADTYAQYRQKVAAQAEQADAGSAARTVVQGETPYRTTHTVLYPTYDRQSSLTQSSDGSCNDPVKLQLNTIGQSTWNTAGQTITWSFTVPCDGDYEIGMRVRQNLARGLFSTRRVRLNGELLFSELNDVCIAYDPDWQVVMLGGKEPYRFFLKAGEYTISMEVVAGKLGPYVQRLQALILDMNQMYREMIMITGTTPDGYRDYKLEQEIPDLKQRMQRFAEQLRQVQAEMESTGIQKGSEAVVVEQLARQLDSFAAQPRSIPGRLNNFQSNISSLSAWTLSLVQQPLEVDYLFVQPAGADKPRANGSFLETMGFRLQSFFGSFFEDYSSLSDGKESSADAQTLNVWIGLGRDQAQIVRDLIANEYTPQHGAKVNLSLVQQGIVEAIAAGKGPDVLLYGGDVINLAARKALVDLSTLEGFEETKDWFAQGAFIPYTYRGGVYALPLEQNYAVLFCRTDILSELELKIPTTWEEFYEATAVLQKNKLTVGVPVGSATAVDNSMFDTLLYQNGGSYYNEDFSATALDSEPALRAFRQWTDFYKKYSFPQSFSFLVRFRSGEMPMAIQNYTTYNTLALAAPEIRGLWEMALLPATVREDGTQSHAVVSGGTPCILLKSARNPQQAFDFIKWFAGAETQTAYGLTVENVLGEGARYDPANLEAFKNMNWTVAEQRLLHKQLEQVRYTPGIPAGYYVSRNLSNAFRAVTIKGINAREALYSYNTIINAEITRKREELGE